MRTFVKIFCLKDKELHQEKKLFWEENVKQDHFQRKIKEEFQIEHVVHGHVPRDYKKGQRISSGDGFAINIDGGFAEAYLNRGHALVQTPKMLYGIILQTEGEPHKDDCVLEQIDIIEEYSHPLTASDTFLAGRLKEKKNIKAKIKAARSKNLTNCTLINFEKIFLQFFRKDNATLPKLAEKGKFFVKANPMVGAKYY